MKKVSFIGSYDKIDLIVYIAKVLVATGKKVIVIDSTILQKAKYIVPVIKPTKAYVTDFEDIEVAVGFSNFKEIKEYLGIPQEEKLPYDIALIDIDTPEALNGFQISNQNKNYFVTGFDLYSLRRGLEILSGLDQVLKLTKVLFARFIAEEEDDYLNYLSLGYKIEWAEEKIYFPFEAGDQSIIAENQRVSKIKFKRLSEQFKDSLLYITGQIAEDENYSQIRRIFKQLEKGE